MPEPMDQGGLPLQQYPEAYPSPPATPPPAWLPEQPATEQAPPPRADYQSQPYKKPKAPPPGGGAWLVIGGWRVTGWQLLLAIGAAAAFWTLLNAYAFARTTAAWNEFDQAPYCLGGAIADGCKASVVVSLGVQRSSPNSGCVIWASPKKGGAQSFRGSFSKDTCDGVHSSSSVAVIVWQGRLVKAPGASPWAPCVGNTPFYAPHACEGAWSEAVSYTHLTLPTKA